MMNKLHTNREYENELRLLRERIVIMAGRVEEMIANSVNALMQSNVDLARRTIALDRRVNGDEMEMDELCLVLLAKRQPLGADLRFITIALKMVTDLERIGDLAVNICERVIKLEQTPEVHPHPKIHDMAQTVRKMIRVAIDAYVNSDAERAEGVIAQDDEVDELYHQVFRDSLNDMMKNDKWIAPLIHIQSVAKWVERIGDHCTNLAEMVVFMVRGTDIRHMGKLDQIKIARMDSQVPMP
jgi:phosphate transport system protein